MRTCPEPERNAHPFVWRLYEELNAADLPRYELEKRAGLGSNTIAAWWSADRAILLQNMEAALGAVGLGLKPCPLPARRGPFVVGRHYATRCGIEAHVTSAENGRLIGSAYSGRLALMWSADGRRLPGGGVDPFDLVEHGT